MICRSSILFTIYDYMIVLDSWCFSFAVDIGSVAARDGQDMGTASYDDRFSCFWLMIKTIKHLSHLSLDLDVGGQEVDDISLDTSGIL